MHTTTYDIIVIGAGSGGLTAAVGFAKVGKTVLLIEKAKMGGECTNTGCIPSKALLHHAQEYAHAAKRAGTTQKLESYRTDAFNFVREKIDEILAEEQPEAFEKIGITVISGEAVFEGTCSIRVGDTIYSFKRAVIATGSSPRPLQIDGLDPKTILTNQNFFEEKEAPEKLLVIGSGPIGMELGQACAMLGSSVTLATIDDAFPRTSDDAFTPIVQRAFEKWGVTTHARAHIARIEKHEAVLEIKNGDAVVDEVRVPFDKILIAIGRVPNIPEGTEAAGITLANGNIVVDGQYRTSNKYVYALGDVVDGDKFTHVADDRARQLVTRLATKGVLRINTGKAIPKITYTEPAIAGVGLSFDDACHTYAQQEIMRVAVPYSANDRARTDDATDGMLVLIVRRITGTVLGAHIVGSGASELIALCTLAINRKISIWKLRAEIYAYPTYALLIKKAGDTFFTQQIADLKHDVVHLLKKHAPKLVALLFWGVLLWLFTNYRLTNDLSYQEMAVIVFTGLAESVWGPLAYILIYTFRPLIFFPATLLTVLAGAIFGFWYGVLYTVVGANLSANLAYWVGRFFGKDIRLEDTALGNWTTALRTRPFASVLFMRLFYVPFDLANYGSGILRVGWPQYTIATIVGTLLGTITFVALGAGVNDISNFMLSFDAFNYRYIALSIGIFVLSLLIARVLNRWQPKKDSEK